MLFLQKITNCDDEIQQKTKKVLEKKIEWLFFILQI